LNVWKQAMALVKRVYEITSRFPDSEIYGLTNQVRRAAVSIPSNIAEGAARSGDREFLKFLFIARGSLSELETQVLIAKELEYLKENEGVSIMSEIEEIFGLSGGLIRSIQKRK
jgi:four helix bundle protein